MKHKFIMENWRRFLIEENPMDKTDAMLKQSADALSDIPDNPRTMPEPELQKSPEIENFKVDWNVDSRFIRKKDYKESIIIVSVEDKGKKVEFSRTLKQLGHPGNPSWAMHRFVKSAAFEKFILKHMPEIKAYGKLKQTNSIQTIMVQLKTGETKRMIIPLDTLRYSKN